MHQRAAESDLLIVNHHLFFADLALRQKGVRRAAAGLRRTGFDEAHEMEDVATQYFGVEVRANRVEELARDTEATLRMKGIKSKRSSFRVGRIAAPRGFVLELFPRTEGRSNFDNRESFLEVNRGAYSSLAIRSCSANRTQPPDGAPGGNQ